MWIKCENQLLIYLLLHGGVRTFVVLFYSPYIHTIILINKHAFGGNNISGEEEIESEKQGKFLSTR